MRFWLMALVTGLLSSVSLCATTIDYQVTGLGVDSSGDTVDTLTYTVTGLTLTPLQELDLFFSPTVYISLADPIVGSAYSVYLEQPNNPPGASGDFGLTPISSSMSVTGPFSINVTLQDLAGPGPENYTVSQFDQNGNFVGIIATGIALPVTGVTTPEPKDLTFAGLAFVFLYLLMQAKRFGFGEQKPK